MSHSSTVVDQLPSVIDDAFRVLQTNYVGFASFTILIWDHIDTFDTEVEVIWKGKKGPIVYLFLLNRYFTPLGYVGNLYAYLSPTWTYERCRHFIRFEGATVMIAIEVVAIMMLLRIQALYHKQRSIIYGVGFLLFCQTTVNAWLLTKGEPVVHNPNSRVRACSMIFDTKISVLAAASAWMPLLYDTIILGLTLYKTIPAYRSKNMSFIMRRILEDGLIYYTVIFAITLILTFMIIAAPPGVKNITAQTEQLLTVTMMSRITLNLKKAARKLDALVLDVDADGVVHHMPLHMDRSFGTQRWQDLMSFQILHTSAVATDA